MLDAFGHVSVRDPRNPHRYLISRSIAPESVTAADILVLDLDSQTVDPKDEGKLLYRERFIHGEIYKVRPDVNAVVHSHSPTVVPFTVTRAKLRPLLHNAGFLGLGVPLFEIRKHAGDGTDLMILTPSLGKDLAKKLGKDAAVVLMRGHGDSVVGPSLPNAVFRAYYTEINARQQLQAITIGGAINFMTAPKSLTSNDAMLQSLGAALGAVAQAGAGRDLSANDADTGRRNGEIDRCRVGASRTGALPPRRSDRRFLQRKDDPHAGRLGPGGGYDITGGSSPSFCRRHMPGNPASSPRTCPAPEASPPPNTSPTWRRRTAPCSAVSRRLSRSTAPSGARQGERGKFPLYRRVTTNIDLGAALVRVGIKSIDDVRNKALHGRRFRPRLEHGHLSGALNAYGGTKFKIVLGYKGTNEILLAMDRGEVDIVGAYGLPGMLVTHPGWIDKGEARSSIRRRSSAMAPAERADAAGTGGVGRGQGDPARHRLRRLKSAAPSSPALACRRIGWRHCVRPSRRC